MSGERDYWDARPISDAMTYPQIEGEEVSEEESERRYVVRRKALAEALDVIDLEDLLESLSTSEGERA